MPAFSDAFRGRTVLVTGHTGFKGAWLCEWLLRLGARVIGYALPPPTEPSLFVQLNLADRLAENHLADINDLAAVKSVVAKAQPDFVFHLAAQPLVIEGYREPVQTFATNVIGTAHLLEALRELKKPCAAVMVTTDKCYENREWVHGYRETDRLGGHDPYSASKAAAELIIASYRSSFFGNHPVRIASARAGNVIGGGDWAANRLVPDCLRALADDGVIPVRNPRAVRPWQHVLEPLSGYLWLAVKLAEDPTFATAFNFGPRHDSNKTVEQLVNEILLHWPGRWEDRSDPKAVHEAGLLQLSIDQAGALLGWSPVWNFSDAIRETVAWSQKSDFGKHDVEAITAAQINAYEGQAAQLGLPWAAQRAESSLSV